MTSSERRRSASVSASSPGTSASVSRKVATSSMRASAAGAGQVAEQEQRRRVGPVAVLEHQQQRAAGADAAEQVGDRGVQAMALGVGVGRHGRRQLADPAGEVGHAGARARRRRRRAPRAARRRRSRGRAARAPRRTARTACGRPRRRRRRAPATPSAAASCGQLAHEPALARARLAAEQDDAAALALGARHQRAERARARRRARRTETSSVRPSEPGRSCVTALAGTIVRSDHRRRRSSARGRAKWVSRVMTGGAPRALRVGSRHPIDHQGGDVSTTTTPAEAARRELSGVRRRADRTGRRRL